MAEAGEAIAEILKREGVENIFGYPVNHILELAARAGIRPIIVRQERIGLHMADALSRLTSGEKIGVFAMQADIATSIAEVLDGRRRIARPAPLVGVGDPKQHLLEPPAFLADANEVAPRGKVVDRPAIVGRVDDGRGFCGKAR